MADVHLMRITALTRGSVPGALGFFEVGLDDKVFCLAE